MKNDIRSFWAHHFLGCELAVVVVVCAAFVVWAKGCKGEQVILDIMAERRGLIYGTVAAIFGSLLGFAIAAESIVLGLSGSEQLRIVRDSKHYPTLWRVFRWTIRTLALATVAALTALIFDRDETPYTLLLYICTFFGLLAAVQLARTIWILEQVVNIVSAKKPRQS